MARIVVFSFVLVTFLVIGVFAVPGKRLRRGFGNSGYGGNSGNGSGYGHGSDERDASGSEEGGGGCNSDNNGRNYSGSRELAAYNRDGRNSNEGYRGGRAFSKSSASASASSSSFNLNQKNNIPN